MLRGWVRCIVLVCYTRPMLVAERGAAVQTGINAAAGRTPLRGPQGIGPGVYPDACAFRAAQLVLEFPF